ncbi:GFA family protein [Roseisalinus antarcticus]|uniref:Glutathione-dependent formaldehyde-activating enzyme n=1 Tax=Roseisalinus antarcticus TaxID=254357 RepID=A0A1Y5TX49_9RHOB|nr:GFA family protein [Roseisalinus antarcticus]SLN72636.1 Glutathione-dependent formaldehyde-activating enzyme [Roseisalinus antarcticus]
MAETVFATGRCACGAARYTLNRPPMIVHCCHCRQCQREAGASFALNALIERTEIDLAGDTTSFARPTGSGTGLDATGCPLCGTILWNVYHASGEAFVWVKVGTLDNPDLCPPSVHIFTATRQPWVLLDDGVPAFEGFYPPGTVWTDAARARRRTARKG